VCEGATLEAVGRSVWEVQDLAEHGRLGPELGPYLARVSGPARNGRPVADHEIRFLHQSDGYIYGVVSLGEVGCYSVLILAFRRNGVVTAATKVALRPLLAIAEKIAWERLAELTRTVKEGDETCG
ncbi:MAG TPA: hypothetical protein VJW94_10245, partial [Candidatus Acidoferrum sp.]|nr:hypothetical protein [Candidatus Acidoferrum sp.]